MTSFRQNVLYIFIIFIVFFGCLKAFAEDIRAEPKGVFLPSSNFVATYAISIDEVKFQMLNHTINTKDSLGSVMVLGIKTLKILHMMNYVSQI